MTTKLPETITINVNLDPKELGACLERLLNLALAQQTAQAENPLQVELRREELRVRELEAKSRYDEGMARLLLERERFEAERDDREAEQAERRARVAAAAARPNYSHADDRFNRR